MSVREREKERETERKINREREKHTERKRERNSTPLYYFPHLSSTFCKLDPLMGIVLWVQNSQMNDLLL